MIRASFPTASKALNFGARAVRRSLGFQSYFPRKVLVRRIRMEGKDRNCSLRGGKEDSRGALVVLEGLDRCGKTTESAILVTNLERSLMESKLKSGTTLVLERYSYSGVAFSSVKGLDIEWCKAPEIGLLAPDLVVYLDIPPEKAAERGGYGGERYEQLVFQKKIAETHCSSGSKTTKPATLLNCLIIDACSSVEDVEEQLQETVLDCVKTCREGKPPLVSLVWLNFLFSGKGEALVYLEGRMQIPGTMSSEQACPAICTRISCRIMLLHCLCFKSRFGVSYSFNSERVGKVSSVSPDSVRLWCSDC